ncbi:MAG: C-GCAxxG-C-C family protein [Bacteroidales bacterium]|jgi:C_GCAxxG_C_C family probable redox protein|nr:C_GCAxxG_C_C family protein [Bacteroidales bacterium]
MKKVTEDYATQCFQNGIDCSQIVFSYGASQHGFEEKQAMKIAAPFGGGMWYGETCGCVIGALMAIGLQYGNDGFGQVDIKQKLLAKKTEFEARFKEKHNSLICREILGYDLSKEEDMKIIMDKGLFFTLCNKVAVSACEILDDVLKSE